MKLVLLECVCRLAVCGSVLKLFSCVVVANVKNNVPYLLQTGYLLGFACLKDHFLTYFLICI